MYTPAPMAPGSVRGAHSRRRWRSDASRPLEKSRPGPPPGLGGVRGSHCGGLRCSRSLRSLSEM